MAFDFSEAFVTPELKFLFGDMERAVLNSGGIPKFQVEVYVPNSAFPDGTRRALTLDVYPYPVSRTEIRLYGEATMFSSRITPQANEIRPALPGFENWDEVVARLRVQPFLLPITCEKIAAALGWNTVELDIALRNGVFREERLGLPSSRFRDFLELCGMLERPQCPESQDGIWGLTFLDVFADRSASVADALARMLGIDSIARVTLAGMAPDFFDNVNLLRVLAQWQTHFGEIHTWWTQELEDTVRNQT